MLEKAVIVKSLKARYNSTLTSTIIHGWTRGLENKGAAKQKEGGAKKKGVHAARAPPPLYTPLHIGTPWFKFRYQA